MSETIDSSSHALAVVTVLDPSQDSHIDLLHRAAIGPVNADYYQPILARFETYDRGSPSWNWAASLCTLNWMAFRGLWRPALAYVGALLVAVLGLMALTHFAAGMAESIQWGLWAALGTLTLLVPGFFGNTWLFNHHRRRLAAALANTPTLRDACLQLSRQASSRQSLMALVAANGLFAVTLMTVWFWPSRTWRDAARINEGRVMVTAVAPASASVASAPTPSVSQPSPAANQAEPVALAASSDAATSMPMAAPTPAADTAISPAAPASAAPDAAAMPPASATSTPVASEAPVASAVLSQAATRHAAIAARSRKAHQEPPQTAADVSAAAKAAEPPAAPPRAGQLSASTANAAAEPASSGRYQINVGLFAEQDNAQRTFARLKEAGLPATAQDLQRNDRTLTRIRVGPFASRDQADAAAQKIRALRLDAVVTRQ
jgi:cell division septation protein DedD